MKPGLAVLRDMPLLGSLDASSLGRLDAIADLARLGPDEPLFAQKEIPAEVHVILAGYAVGLASRDGRPVCVDVFGPGAVLGLSPAILGRPAVVGASTATAARIVSLSAAPLAALMRHDAEVNALVLRAALCDSERLTRETVSLKLHSAAQRTAAYLLGLVAEQSESPARFVLPYAKQLLAARIGCSQENLSRAFATLRRVGVESRSGVVVITDLPALRSFADAGQT